MEELKTMECLIIENVSFSFGFKEILKDINFTLEKGKVVSIVGPSGGGKTTLLHLCAKLLTLEDGKIKNSFKISFDMARDYIEYLKNAYMIYEIKKFDYSLRKQNLNDKKYYSADLGLSNLYRVANLKFKGSNLETIVALELLRRGFKIYYYKTQNGLEIDFVVVKNNKIEKLDFL